MLWSPEKSGYAEINSTKICKHERIVGTWILIAWSQHFSKTTSTSTECSNFHMFHVIRNLGAFWICLAAKFLSAWRAWHSGESLTSHQWDGWDDCQYCLSIACLCLFSRGLGPFSLKSACKKIFGGPTIAAFRSSGSCFLTKHLRSTCAEQKWRTWSQLIEPRIETSYFLGLQYSSPDFDAAVLLNASGCMFIAFTCYLQKNTSPPHKVNSTSGSRTRPSN